MKKTITCPDCQTVITLEENVTVGDIIECPECGTEVEITSINPLTFREIIETK